MKAPSRCGGHGSGKRRRDNSKSVHQLFLLSCAALGHMAAVPDSCCVMNIHSRRGSDLICCAPSMWTVGQVNCFMQIRKCTGGTLNRKALSFGSRPVIVNQFIQQSLKYTQVSVMKTSARSRVCQEHLPFLLRLEWDLQGYWRWVEDEENKEPLPPIVETTTGHQINKAESTEDTQDLGKVLQ